MLKPTNAIAENIERLKNEVEMCTRAIAQFQASIDKNNEAIQALEPLATWEEVPDEVA